MVSIRNLKFGSFYRENITYPDDLSKVGEFVYQGPFEGERGNFPGTTIRQLSPPEITMDEPHECVYPPYWKSIAQVKKDDSDLGKTYGPFRYYVSTSERGSAK